MATDWKDALNALKASGSIPEAPEGNGDENIETAVPPAHKDRLKVTTDRKGRKGKTAVIIEGFTCPDNEVEDIARRLKQRLGTGGSARGGEILVQGDRKEDVKAALAAMGFMVAKG